MTKKKALIIVSIFVSILIVILVFKPFQPSELNLRYKTEEIKRGNLENLVTSTGTLSPLETVEVGSQVSGIIEKINVDFNDPVTKGQILTLLDKTLFKVSVEDREASVTRAQANLNRAKAEVKRNEPLFKKGHVSEMEFLVIKTDAKKAEADLKIAQAGLNKSMVNLEYCEIKSPIKGTVIERSIDEGQTIAANFQAPKLFVIAKDLRKMQIEAKVDESDIGLIIKGQEARFTVQAYPDKKFSGAVRQIRLQPETIQNVVNYTVIVDAPNNERLLLPGMTATIDFVIEDVEDVLIISNKTFNFSPSMEQMRKIFQRMQGGMPFAGGSHGSRGMFKIPADMGRVFYLNNDNLLTMAIFKKGVTDGMATEIKSVIQGKLFSGIKVITGIEKKKKRSSGDGSKNILLPRPGPGGGPR